MVIKNLDSELDPDPDPHLGKPCSGGYDAVRPGSGVTAEVCGRSHGPEGRLSGQGGQIGRREILTQVEHRSFSVYCLIQEQGS